MYPYLKLSTTLFKAKKRPTIELHDKSILNCRAGITDIDIFGELNNARYFSYMELGRWDFSSRVGFLDLMKKNKWGVAVGGSSIRYRRRIPFFSKFRLSTQLLCHDGRWFYFLQETHMKDKICSSALIKLGTTSKNGLVAASEVLEAYGIKDYDPEIPEWVNAWIEAEGKRPWPES